MTHRGDSPHGGHIKPTLTWHKDKKAQGDSKESKVVSSFASVTISLILGWLFNLSNCKSNYKSPPVQIFLNFIIFTNRSGMQL